MVGLALGGLNGGFAGPSRNEHELLRLQSEIVLPCGLHARNAALHLNSYGIHVAEASFERVGLEDRRGARFPEKDFGRFTSQIDLVRGCLASFNSRGKTHCAGRLCNRPTLDGAAARATPALSLF